MPIVEIVSIVASALHLLGAGSALHAIFYARSPQGSVAWVVSLMTFPYVALPLYWVFGRGRFQGYVLARRRGEGEINDLALRLREYVPEFRAPLGPRDEDLRVLERLARMPFTRGNRLRLLIDGTATFEAIFAAIEAAERYVLVQFFIVRDDELGREFHALLLRKAAAGVRVHILYDEIGSHALPHSYVDSLRAGGVEIHPFHTRKGRRNRFQINFRNHRKIVVADGRVAYVGGLNVGDEYMGRGKRFGPWRDTHLELEGPSVQCVQLSFLEDWWWATHRVPEMDWIPLAAAEGDQSVLVLPTGPADDFDACGLFFCHAIQAAKRRLWIASPYFVPDSSVVSALVLAGLRGVDVRIMLPEKPDHELVYLAAFSYFPDCEKAGVKFYRYQPGFLHQKVMLVDDDAAAVGTANLDNRSFRLNFEITALSLDRRFAADVERMLERDLAHCRLVGMKDVEHRGVWFQLAVRGARLLAPSL